MSLVNNTPPLIPPCVPDAAIPTKIVRQSEPFLKGPIPWRWICQASMAGSGALGVGIKVWHLSALTKSKCVRLNLQKMMELGISRHKAARGLAKLEQVGLVSVVRSQGRRAEVTILPARKLLNEEVTKVSKGKEKTMEKMDHYFATSTIDELWADQQTLLYEILDERLRADGFSDADIESFHNGGPLDNDLRNKMEAIESEVFFED